MAGASVSDSLTSAAPATRPPVTSLGIFCHRRHAPVLQRRNRSIPGLSAEYATVHTSAVRTPIILLLLCVGCRPDGEPVAGEPGAPLPDMSTQELALFNAGRALFEKMYTPAEGLGPFFNENLCNGCHSEPATGGTTAFEIVTKATRFSPPAACDALDAVGGSNVRAQTIDALRALGVERQPMPSGATHTGHFAPPPLFGLGLVELVPDADIERRADPDDADGDGISGRASRVADGRLGRFGRKADVASIREFVTSALKLEMGLTTSEHPGDDTFDARLAGLDTVPDPEVDDASVEMLAAFVRYLVPPARVVPRSAAHRDSIAIGERLFHSLGCASCHTPQLRAGPSPSAALNRRVIGLYSDQLLHDMGPRLANTCTRSAAPTELRTTPLMGLRYRERFLYDGRTSDLRDAILQHGGEAQRARDAFERSGFVRQEYLIQFLRSL
jgi:CxxC motif-containing protein (DUF1111 family)